MCAQSCDNCTLVCSIMFAPYYCQLLLPANFRNDVKYAVGIAECILSLASTVPQGEQAVRSHGRTFHLKPFFSGVLVFFASYSLMHSLILKFKQYKYGRNSAKTYWDCMIAEKTIVVEPKLKASLVSTIEYCSSAIFHRQKITVSVAG